VFVAPCNWFLMRTHSHGFRACCCISVFCPWFRSLLLDQHVALTQSVLASVSLISHCTRWACVQQLGSAAGLVVELAHVPFGSFAVARPRAHCACSEVP
jgi:hypothetical protein